MNTLLNIFAVDAPPLRHFPTKRSHYSTPRRRALEEMPTGIAPPVKFLSILPDPRKDKRSAGLSADRSLDFVHFTWWTICSLAPDLCGIFAFFRFRRAALTSRTRQNTSGGSYFSKRPASTPTRSAPGFWAFWVVYLVHGGLTLRLAPAKARPQTSVAQQMRSTCQRALPAAPFIDFGADLTACSNAMLLLRRVQRAAKLSAPFIDFAADLIRLF